VASCSYLQFIETSGILQFIETSGILQLIETRVILQFTDAIPSPHVGAHSGVASDPRVLPSDAVSLGERAVAFSKIP